MKNLILILILVGYQSLAWSRTVCSVTINSSNEISKFKSRLQRTDPNLQFVELTTKGSSKDWLQKACESGVQCDSLVISGHFAWAFFSEKENGLQMTSEEMQAASCSNRCQGIFSQPKEVFLFGCNTLASPQRDHRTPEQYKQVLLGSGFSNETAEMVVACRYKNIGCSSTEKMKQIFKGSPLIYGFDSTSPLGADSENSVNSLLTKAIQRDGSYNNRLNRIEAAHTMGTIEEMNRQLSGYRSDWASSFGGSATSCYGNKSNNQNDIDECVLLAKDRTQTEKLAAIERLLESPNRKRYMLSIHKYISEIDAQKLSATDLDIINRIKGNVAARSDFMGIYNQLSSLPYLKIRYSNLGRRLGWISIEQNRNDINTYLAPYTSDSLVNRNESDSIRRAGPMNVQYADQPTLPRSEEGVKVVGLTRTDDTHFTSPLVQIIDNPATTPSRRDDALRSLAQIRPADRSNVVAYQSLLRSSDDEVLKSALIYAPYLPNDERTNDQILGLAERGTPVMRVYACDSLKNILNSSASQDSSLRASYNRICR